MSVLPDEPVQGGQGVHDQVSPNLDILRCTATDETNARSTHGEILDVAWVEQPTDVGNASDDGHIWVWCETGGEDLDELVNRCDVNKPDTPAYATRQLVAVEMGVAHREKGESDFFEDAALQQPAEIADEDGILVFTDAVVQLQVEDWWKTSA